MAKRWTAAQIQAVLSAVEKDPAKGLAVADNCRRHGITGSRSRAITGGGVG
jgi:hypothetical protein